MGAPVAFAEFLARNEEVAVVVSGIVGYPAGFSLSIVFLSRLNPPRRPFDPFAFHRHLGMPQERGPFRFGVGFADGTKLFAEQGAWPPMPQGNYILRRQGGGGGGRTWRQGFFCQPLPPPGALHLVCEWPAYDIPESRLEMDATIVLDAADRARPVWPEDVGLPEPPDRPQSPGFISRSVSAGATAVPRERREPNARPPSDPG